jgi:hypothetical protein
MLWVKLTAHRLSEPDTREAWFVQWGGGSAWRHFIWLGGSTFPLRIAVQMKWVQWDSVGRSSMC